MPVVDYIFVYFHNVHVLDKQNKIVLLNKIKMITIHNNYYFQTILNEIKNEKLFVSHYFVRGEISNICDLMQLFEI